VRHRGLSPTFLVGIVVVGLTLIPLGYVIWETATMGPGQLHDLLWRPRVGELLGNTLALLVGTVALTTLIGLVGAIAVVRTDLRGKGWWHALLSAPLAVPAFVNSYGWVSLTHSVQSYAGAVMVVSLSYYPLVYLPVVAMLRRLDPALEESAWSLGHSRARTFRSVVLPQLRPALLGGALLVGLHLLAEYGALQLLNYPTLTTGILDQYRVSFNGPGATMLALVLVAFCLVLLGLELLVAADIIHTVMVKLTLKSVAALAGIVIIRTLLSFSLEAEIDGQWPWQRGKQRASESKP